MRSRRPLICRCARLISLPKRRRRSALHTWAGGLRGDVLRLELAFGTQMRDFCDGPKLDRSDLDLAVLQLLLNVLLRLQDAQGHTRSH